MANKDEQFTYPEQIVAPGRGEAGYTGNVKVIPAESRKDKAKAGAKAVVNTGLDKRRALAAEAKELGIPASGSNDELEAAIAEAKAGQTTTEAPTS